MISSITYVDGFMVDGCVLLESGRRVGQGITRRRVIHIQ